MPTKGQLVSALVMVAELGSIPIREQSNQRSTFASTNLTRTKTRTVPAGTAWTDYLLVQMGEADAPSGFAATIDYYVASGLVDPATSGLQYRFLKDGALMASQEFSMPAGVDMTVDHLALAPFPAQKRRLNIKLYNRERFVLQVRNTGVADTVAIAALMGYCYPNQSSPREAQENTGFDHSDNWHG
jgi:hypothetical protein